MMSIETVVTDKVTEESRNTTPITTVLQSQKESEASVSMSTESVLASKAETTIKLDTVQSGLDLPVNETEKTEQP